MKRQNNVNFSDLNVSFRDCAIHTNFFIKPIDGHQYLIYQSAHPQHIKEPIPYIQELKVSRICSSEKGFTTHICRMKQWFIQKKW